MERGLLISLRRGYSRCPTTHPQLRGSHSQGRKACRYAGRTADQVRTRHLHEDGEGDRSDDPATVAAARGRRAPVMALCASIAGLALLAAVADERIVQR